jgi:hypothetical protein
MVERFGIGVVSTTMLAEHYRVLSVIASAAKQSSRAAMPGSRTRGDPQPGRLALGGRSVPRRRWMASLRSQ